MLMSAIGVDVGVEVLAERLLDPFYLPSKQDFLDVFGDSEEDKEADRRWDAFCRNKKLSQYEVLNKEFVESLGGYLCLRAELFEDRPTILEVGSGNGRLAYFLNRRLAELDSGIEVIASDSGQWGIEPITQIEELSCEDALSRHEPEIVLCSWMPRGVDHTAAIRAQISVSEYLLIGEVEFGCCGSDMLTWGVAIDDDGNMFENSPLYKAGGFTRNRVDEVSIHQMCVTDSLNQFIHSQTISFRRETA